jgi:hypothetical protein
MIFYSPLILINTEELKTLFSYIYAHFFTIIFLIFFRISFTSSILLIKNFILFITLGF